MLDMRKFKPIKVVIHLPKDIKAFENIYEDATLAAIKQLAEATPKKHSKQNPPEIMNCPRLCRQHNLEQFKQLEGVFLHSTLNALFKPFVDYFEASSTATAQATVAPTIGLLPKLFQLIILILVIFSYALKPRRIGLCKGIFHITIIFISLKTTYKIT